MYLAQQAQVEVACLCGKVMLRHLGCVCVFQALSSGSVEMRSGVVVTIEIRWVQAVVLPWRHCSIASQLLPSYSKEQHEVAVLGWRGL